MNQRTVLPSRVVDIAEDSMHALLGVGVFVVALISTYQGVARLLPHKRES